MTHGEFHSHHKRQGWQPVTRLIPGALERVTVTPELKSRIKRVSSNCDAEIIR